MEEEKRKVIERSKTGRHDVSNAQSFLELVIALRGSKPFLFKGIYRFIFFERTFATK